MPTQDLGPTGHRAAENFKQLRYESGISLRDLSAKLDDDLGRPIPPASLMKIEKQTRRIDVDDLAALALALDVSPNRLLLTGDGGHGEIYLTPKYSAPHKETAWMWACGQNRLPVPLSSGPSSLAEAVRFIARSRPHEVRRIEDNETEFRQYREHLAPIAKAARAAQDAGVPFQTIMNYLRLSDAIDTAEE